MACQMVENHTEAEYIQDEGVKRGALSVAVHATAFG
jgi:hypothetical protein